MLEKRGLSDPVAISRFLQADLSDLGDPLIMKGIPEAVGRIRRAASSREKILIHGDYDADGITASAILARTLQKLGVEFRVFLPERSKDGYGVSAPAIREAASEQYRILITVDCGISAHDEIREARSLGMEVIVIDHHRIPVEGGPRDAIIINPQQEDCPYPFRELSAGGLAFKLSQALIGTEAFTFLDLAALSTVADVAPLLDENRIIVKHGMKQMAETRNIGLKALIQTAGIRAKEMNVGHLGFMLGPRINACGRMGAPDAALRLFMTASETEAQKWARLLDEENQARQREERAMVQEAIQEADRTVNFNRERIVVVGREGWHQGVIGIVAARLVEKYERPAIVIGFEGERGKGSGRSIQGFDLFKSLQDCAGLLEQFGGHEQAAGLVIAKAHFIAFKKKINEYAMNHCPSGLFVKKKHADLGIELSQIHGLFVRELRMLEPHGVGNPRPVFLTRGLLLKTKPVRISAQTLQFWVTDGAMTYEARLTSRFEKDMSGFEQGTAVDLYYTLKSYTAFGEEKISFEIKALEPAAAGKS